MVRRSRRKNFGKGTDTTFYNQVNSKVGNLARKRRKFLSPEGATIAESKARVRMKIVRQSRRRQKPILESRAV